MGAGLHRFGSCVGSTFGTGEEAGKYNHCLERGGGGGLVGVSRLCGFVQCTVSSAQLQLSANFLFFKQIFQQTRMHSSRMRTAHSLTISDCI